MGRGRRGRLDGLRIVTRVGEWRLVMEGTFETIGQLFLKVINSGA